MATNHTENYALNLWEPEDAFLRAEFNENSEKLDAAIVAAVRKAETELAQTFSQSFSVTNPPFVMGYYTGDSRYPRDITLGFRARFILLGAADNSGYYGVHILTEKGMWSVASQAIFIADNYVTATGFRLGGRAGNYADSQAVYFAFR